MAKTATMAPLNGTIELAGPERISLDDLVRRYFAAKRDPRKVIADVHARYFGTELDDKSLTPGDHPHIGSISFTDWLGRQPAIGLNTRDRRLHREPSQPVPTLADSACTDHRLT